MLKMVPKVLWLLTLLPSSLAWINATQYSNEIVLANDNVTFVLNKTNGIITYVGFNGVNILGTPVGNTSAIGPYADIYIPPLPSFDYNPFSVNASFQLVTDTDSDGTPYGGLILTQPNPEGNVGLVFQQYWFLRANETGLHQFSRLAYSNSNASLANLGEFIQLRTLFRPHGYFFTHLSSTDDFYVPQPRPNPAIDSVKDLGIATQVQDTTWYIGNRTGDPYVANVADYYTKYTMHAIYRDHLVHGLFADGTETPDNTTYGAFTIYNTKDTFFGGPTYADLVVDGLMYNYIISNHFGDSVPNITNGFDRTFGPAIFYLNHGAKGGSLDTLRNDAKSFASNTYAAQFYDDIAKYVTGYVPTANRGSWTAKIEAPKGANNTIAILSVPGYDPQDNVADPSAYQYWVEVPSSGCVEITRIKSGDYQLTVYADGIFGDFVYNGTISVEGGQNTDSGIITWKPESHGKELWRLGVPDKSAGEYKHGYQRDPSHPLHPPEYRIYWGAYDFINDFPNGVNFKIGESNLVEDWNYVHWSAFGGSLTRPQLVGDAKINNWTVSFDLKPSDIKGTSQATFTVQMAGVSTSAGNTDTYSNTTKYNSLPFNVVVNGNALTPWVIPYYHSSSCATRSGISCYHTAHQFEFPASYLVSNVTNELVLSLPFNASGISVLYDALRLEVA